MMEQVACPEALRRKGPDGVWTPRGHGQHRCGRVDGSSIMHEAPPVKRGRCSVSEREYVLAISLPTEHDEALASRLRISKQGLHALFLAQVAYPDLYEQTFAAIEEQSRELLRSRFPRALPVPFDSVARAHERKLFGSVLGGMADLLEPANAPSAPVSPRRSLVVALSIATEMLALVLPYEGPCQLDIPPDLDSESFLDTVAVLCCNPLAPSGLFSEVVSQAVRRVLSARTGFFEDPVHSAVLSGYFASGGLTPNAVRSILDSDDVDKDIEVALGIKGQWWQFVSDVRRTYQELEQCHRCGLNLDAFADYIEGRATSHDLLDGLRGQWLDLLDVALPLWPPATATAHVLLDSTRRDVWLGRTITAARRAHWRQEYAKRSLRKRTAVHLDSGAYGTQGEGASRHELVPDEDTAGNSADCYLELQEMLSEAGLTDQERRTAEGLARGDIPAEIARDLGVSAARVTALKQQIEAKLRQKGYRP